jgi:integrase
MASVSRSADGRVRILFVDKHKKRRAIHLGKATMKVANEIRIRVEAINSALIAGTSRDRETDAWLAKIGDDLAKKLQAVGLYEGRASGTLDDFIGEYIKSRTDAKPRSIMSMERTRVYLTQFFPPSQSLKSITPGDCDRFFIWLKGKYAEATASRHLRRARQFFTAARRQRLVTENVFEGIKSGSEKNSERLYFVSRADSEKLLETAPCAEWRAIIALSRFGGLRCPSEHLALKWGDINWDQGKMLVHSSKGEHHAGKGKRWVPIFPELRPYLEDLFDAAEPGTVHVISKYRDPSQNLRTTFSKIIHRAGLIPWPRLFQNLRSTRETELAASHPIHVVCAWIGNSQIIAAKHYLQVTDEDFQRAARGDEKPTRQTTQTPPEQARHGPSSDAE